MGVGAGALAALLGAVGGLLDEIDRETEALKGALHRVVVLAHIAVDLHSVRVLALADVDHDGVALLDRCTSDGVRPEDEAFSKIVTVGALLFVGHLGFLQGCFNVGVVPAVIVVERERLTALAQAIRDRGTLGD